MTSIPTGPDDPGWDELPAPIQQQILLQREQALKLQIAADDYRHGILRFIREASYDHLIIFRNVMHNITWATRPDIFSSFYEAQAGMELMTRFNICAACSVDHYQEIKGGDNPSLQGGNSPETPDQPIEELKDAGKQFVNIYNDLTAADLMHMDQYGLDDLRSDGTPLDNEGQLIPEGRLMGFICTRCQRQQWPSIEDRMKDPSDESGCSGCRQKAKWG
jgi:hypothetical protein